MKVRPTLTKLGAIAALVAVAVLARMLAGTPTQVELSASGDPPSQASSESPASEPASRLLTDALGLTFESPSVGLLETGTGLGVLLLGAWLLGKVLASVGFSKITGYLVFGILAGPGVGAWIVGKDGTWLLTKPQQENLQLVNDLAIALIALTAGGEIKLSFVRKAFRSISLILAFEFTLVLLVVGALMTVLLNGTVIAEYGGLVTVMLVASVIAVVATANSPAVVMALLSETRADGPMARTALSITVCKDLLLIIVFAVTLTLASTAATNAKQTLAEDLPTDPPPTLAEAEASDELTAQEVLLAREVAEELESGELKSSSSKQSSIASKLTRQLGGSMLAGVLVGGLLAFYVRKVKSFLPIVLVLGSFAVALISKELGLKTLIVGLTAGLVMSNLFQTIAEDVFHTIEELSVPVYALFFAVAGTKVDPGVLGGVWIFVVLLVTLRLGAIWGGTALGCKVSGMEPPASRWIWTAFVPQAGVSLALAIVVYEQFYEFKFADDVFNILLSAIAINELIGPILFKLGLVRAGEVRSKGD